MCLRLSPSMRVRWSLRRLVLLLHGSSMVVWFTPSAACFGPDGGVGVSSTSLTGRAMDLRRGPGCQLVGLWIGLSSPLSTNGILINLQSVGAAPEGSLTVRPARLPVLCLILSRDLSHLPTTALRLPPRMRTFTRTVRRSSSPPPAPLLPPGVVLLLGLLGPSLGGGVLS